MVLSQICLTFFNVLLCLIRSCNSVGLTPCLDSTGLTYLPSATSCSNEIEDAICNEIFAAADHTPGAVVIDSDCINPDMTKISLECANRCGMCCERKEYACGDSETSPINCAANIARCRDPAWAIVMTTYCPGTCGTCLNQTCRDLNNRCIDMIPICNHLIFRDFMTSRCAETCDRCSTNTVSVTTTLSSPQISSTSCSDTSTNCARNVAFCNNPTYYNLMTQKCPRTCNRCPGSLISSNNNTCSDTNPNCAAWVRNGFCGNSFYSIAQRRQLCGRSCNLC